MLSIEIVNAFQLLAKSRANSQHCAFYLYRNNEVIEKTKYSSSNEHVFNLARAGNYRVKVFLRDHRGNKQTSLSTPLRFEGLAPEPFVERSDPIAIYGITKNSIAAAKIFQKRNEVIGIIDPSGVLSGTTIFDIPVLSSPPREARLVGLEGYQFEEPKIETFSMTVGAYDILSTELKRIGAMDIYHIAHFCYLNGMSRAAHFLEMWILAKYNTRLAHQAQIGEGTRLGVGGMGIAVHAKSKIGKNCVIGQNVTIGIRGSGPAPTIGDHVFIAPGAKCLGGKIGDNSVIGANAVVLSEVPANSVVAGVPARIISSNSENYTGYTHKTLSR